MSYRRATQPLNPDAVKAANAAVAAETGGRALTMGPEDAALRKKWMDAYIAAGGAYEEVPPSGNKPGDPVAPSTPPPANKPDLIANRGDVLVPPDGYKDCPADVKDDISSKEFTDEEKQAIDEVLKNYQPLMKCDNQPLKAVGRADKGISHDANGDFYSEDTTSGEWFSDQGTLVLMDAASQGSDFPNDPDKQFKATAAHEIAHAIAGHGKGPGFDPRDCKEYPNPDDNPLMQEFKKAAGWNEAGDTLVETNDDKAPTDYAKTNPDEDFAESAMLYQYDPDKLKQQSPARYEFMKKLFEGS